MRTKVDIIQLLTRPWNSSSIIVLVVSIENSTWWSWFHCI